MSAHISKEPAFLGETAYLPRVTVHDGLALEQALAGPDLWQSSVDLRGAVVEASFAQSDPPQLRRLSETDVDYIVDPQTLRFASSTFLGVARIGGLAYAPGQPLLRLDPVHHQLVEARDSAAVVTRTLADRELEVRNFDHLERWLGVLSRLTETQDKAA